MIKMNTNAIDANAIDANAIDANAKAIDANANAKAIEVNDIELDFKSEQEQEPKKTNITSIILKCLEYSNDAYGVDDPNTKLQHKEFANSLFNRVNLYYEIMNDSIFIAFRGTVTIYDVINDINFIKAKMDEITTTDVYVHRGFYHDFKDIKSFLRDLIEDEKEKSVKNIYFTGHSRGSSICTISSVFIKTEFPDLNVYNIGFGCPRIGCEQFTNYYNKLLRDTTYLFREEFDIVAKLPIYGYGDLMNQYMIKNNKVVSLYHPIDDDEIIDMIESRIKYHRLEVYQKCDYSVLP
jgi:hypothetical protein